MMKKRLTWFVLLSSMCLSSYGQYEKFDLSKFYLPDLERRTLETDFDFSGSNYSHNYESLNLYDDENQGSDFNGNLNLNYYVYKNTRQYQRNNRFHFSLQSGFNKNEQNENYSEQTRFEPQLSWRRTNRKYFKPTTFFEVNQKVQLQSRFYKLDANDGNMSYDDSDYKYYTFVGQLPLKFGKGRIEPVQDVRHAIYLLDELAKINRLRKAQSDEEIMALGQFIAKIKNNRFFDSRIKRMAEIEAVDSFLTANDYTQDKDARFYTTLGDYWDYGAGPTRRAGQRISFVVQPGYYLYGYNGDNWYLGNGKINFTAFTVDAGIEFAYEKPINLYWQNSINAYVTGGYVLGKKDNQNDDTENEVTIPNLHAGVEQRVGYYPNTRTFAYLGVGAEHIRMDVDIEDVEDSSGKRASTNIMGNLGVEYYFSPRFRLSARANFMYYVQDASDLNQFQFGEGVGTTSYLESLTNQFFYALSDDYKYNRFNTSFSVKLLYKIF